MVAGGLDVMSSTTRVMPLTSFTIRLLIRASTRRYLLEHDLSLPEWRMLTILARYRSGTTGALRTASRMDKGQMSRALLKLEKRRLVQRTQDETHELRQLLELTDKGLQLYQRIMPNARRAQVAKWSLLANRIGYLLFAVAIAVFVIAFAVGFNGAMVTIISGSMILGSILLAPSIVLGYAVKAAERDDRERGL